MLNQILERYNLKYDDLNAAERETLLGRLAALQTRGMTVEDVKKYIASMKHAVELDLTKTTHNSKQDLFLKARLRNYILLESFLTGPKQAKEQLERAVASFASRIK